MTMRWFVVASLLAAAALGVGAVATAHEGEAVQEDELERLLEAIDLVPPSREALEARWPDAKARLIAVATDESRTGYTRLRALSFLSYFAEPDVLELLLRLGDHDEVEVRRLALYTAGRAFGPVASASLVARLERAANEDPSDEVAAHAVRALRWIDAPPALFALERLQKSARTEALRTLAQTTLTRRAERLVSPPSER